jgi:hypothetical protein
VSSATVEAGNLAVIAVALDNFGTTDGDHSEITGVVDSAGNTWTKGGEYTYGQGLAGEGATAGVWFCRLASQLTSGGTITITFSGTATAMAASGWEYTVGAAIAVAGTPVGNGTTTANSYGSAVISGLASAQRLYFRALARESNFADSTQITPSTGFNAITAIRSHNSAASMNLRGEWRINTSTGETSNPSIANNAQDSAAVFVALEEVSGGYTIAADAGSYAVTGTAASLEYGREVAAVAGSYAITGQAATLRRALPITALAGSYAITGTAASLEYGREVAAAAGSYAITGTAATLRRALPLTAVAGSYALTGQDASLEFGREVVATGGSYALNGQPALLEFGYEVAAAAGAYALTGADASLEFGREVEAVGGSYAVDGANATLVYSAIAAAYEVDADAGSYAIAGQPALLEVGYEVAGAAGSYEVTGSDATLNKGQSLSADGGSYDLAGTDVDLLLGYALSAEGGSYIVTGADAGLIYSADVPDVPLFDYIGTGGPDPEAKKRRKAKRDEWERREIARLREMFDLPPDVDDVVDAIEVPAEAKPAEIKRVVKAVVPSVADLELRLAVREIIAEWDQEDDDLLMALASRDNGWR